MEAKKELFSELNPEERFKALQEYAQVTTKEKVRRHYTPEDTDQHREYITNEGIKLMDAKKEFADISSEFRKTIKTYDDQIKDALTCVKRGYSENEETVFGIDDQDRGMMDVYDIKGVLLYSRPLHPEEKQARIAQLKTA